MDLNVLVRGQSNALLFADRGGAAALEKGLEAALGVNVNMLYEWNTNTSTIWSGTAFMSWDTDGEQASLLRYVNNLPADVKDNPTLTLWMHNEADQGDTSLTTQAWLGEVRTDAALVRSALGQTAATTPYEFVPIRYPYGSNFQAIGDGMAALDTDPTFNADISWAAQSLLMNGGPEAGNNGSHMGDADAVNLGTNLTTAVAAMLRPLAGTPATTTSPAPTTGTTTPATPAPTTTAPATPAVVTIGTGTDKLVLSLSQDAYQGSAQYTVSVDGTQVGGTLTASALHASGQHDTVTVLGSWAGGNHTVAVNFLQDAWGGSAATDRNLYVDGATYNGAAVTGTPASLLVAGPATLGFFDADPVAPNPSFPPASLTVGSGTDKLVLSLSQDAYQGSAQYTVSVDGTQVGGTLTASALHASGQHDTVTVLGSWAGGNHTVAVNFLQDAWGGSAATDRNLYVDGATYNGAAVTGTPASLLVAGPATLGFFDADPVAPNPSFPPSSLTVGSGSDKLVLSLSQDAYQGSAQFTVKVDGVQVGGTLTASALHASGQHDTVTVLGDWAAGSHTGSVAFLNDAWGGTAATDRNLYVDGATYNGAAVAGASASLMSPGAANFGFTDTTAAPASPPASPPAVLTVGAGADKLVLSLSQDAYQGPAQYTVSVDGKQVGGVLTASALHSSGLHDTVTVLGDWAHGNHTAAITFLNDAWGGTAATDRNLYLDSATYDGTAVPGATAALMSAGSAGFGFVDVLA